MPSRAGAAAGPRSKADDGPRCTAASAATGEARWGRVAHGAHALSSFAGAVRSRVGAALLRLWLHHRRALTSLRRPRTGPSRRSPAQGLQLPPRAPSPANPADQPGTLTTPGSDFAACAASRQARSSCHYRGRTRVPKSNSTPVLEVGAVVRPKERVDTRWFIGFILILRPAAGHSLPLQDHASRTVPSLPLAGRRTIRPSKTRTRDSGSASRWGPSARRRRSVDRPCL